MRNYVALCAGRRARERGICKTTSPSGPAGAPREQGTCGAASPRSPAGAPQFARALISYRFSLCGRARVNLLLFCLPEPRNRRGTAAQHPRNSRGTPAEHPRNYRNIAPKRVTHRNYRIPGAAKTKVTRETRPKPIRGAYANRRGTPAVPKKGNSQNFRIPGAAKTKVTRETRPKPVRGAGAAGHGRRGAYREPKNP